MKKFLSLITLYFFLAVPAMAQDMSSDVSTQNPVEITADKTIEWLREDNKYRAVGNAVAVQGENRVEADTLEALYDPENGQSDITQLIATGDLVKLISDGRLITGQKAIYDTKTGHLKVTGNNLRFSGPGQEITARDSLEYFSEERKAIARGNAYATNEENTIEADTMTAFFAENGDTTELKEVQAQGNIKIITPTEVVFGEQGVYNAQTEQAEVTGNVRITRGKNQLNGQRATVDMKTGISQMFGKPEQGGRVKALFYPKEDEEETNSSQNDSN